MTASPVCWLLWQGAGVLGGSDPVVLCLCICCAGGVVVMSHTLDMLQQHQQPLQQCAALFSHIQTFLKGVTCI